MDKHRLIVDSVVVRFGEKTVLTGGYITSETGMVTGLLGRNGAGSDSARQLMRPLRRKIGVIRSGSVALNSGRPRKRKSTGGVKVQFVPVIVHIRELYQS